MFGMEDKQRGKNENKNKNRRNKRAQEGHKPRRFTIMTIVQNTKK